MREQWFYRLTVIKEKLKGLSLNQFLKVSVVALFVVTIPFTVHVAQQQQEIRQRAEEINKIPEITNTPSLLLTPTPTLTQRRY